MYVYAYKVCTVLFGFVRAMWSRCLPTASFMASRREMYFEPPPRPAADAHSATGNNNSMSTAHVIDIYYIKVDLS